MDLYLIVVIVLFVLAISDLVVGVSNDAVNFLNSAIGSKVAPRYIIMIVASIGILAGTTFSSGLMEVARKGIFNPEMFLFPEIMTIFLAVMLTDVILLDLYNTFALPTSTTVSIVFELLGAAVAVSVIKASSNAGVSLMDYINTSKAIAIISGILLSIVVAFSSGVIVQFVTRLIFTFDYEKRFRRYGAMWGAVALTAITFFILIKGTKGASFLDAEAVAWINANVTTIILGSLIFWTIIFQAIILLTKLNILRFIVLVGTFALALAFAANDLVNFIGVPLAGLSSFKIAADSSNPLELAMQALREPVQTKTILLMAAGVIMVLTLWFSKKARSVTKTEVNLSRQTAGYERFESSAVARGLVRLNRTMFQVVQEVVPKTVLQRINKRLETRKPERGFDGKIPAFDLLRASVNLMVASILISFATSLKLPLSTTYVTFMVAMGSSLSDRAWGRESAVYRINGVLTVIGGWFFTAFSAFMIAAIFATIIFYGGLGAIIALVLVALFFVIRTHVIHKNRELEEEEKEKRQLAASSDGYDAIKAIMEDTRSFMDAITRITSTTFNALAEEDRTKLKDARKEAKNLQKEANLIVSDIYNSLKVFKLQEVKKGKRFGKLMASIQGCGNNVRSLAQKCYDHIDNNHRSPAEEQMKELDNLCNLLNKQIEETKKMFEAKDFSQPEEWEKSIATLKEKLNIYDESEIERIKKGMGETRNSILFLDVLDDLEKVSDHLYTLANLTRKSYTSFKD